MKKSIKNIICVGLLTSLTIALGLTVKYAAEMTDRYDELSNEYKELSDVHDNLQNKYDNLKGKYDDLQNETDGVYEQIINVMEGKPYAVEFYYDGACYTYKRDQKQGMLDKTIYDSKVIVR